jgi:hypothetical protein
MKSEGKYDTSSGPKRTCGIISVRDFKVFPIILNRYILSKDNQISASLPARIEIFFVPER